MSAVLYPVAATAAEALSAPLGRAAREREAATLAGAPVSFVSEETGPAFTTREAALDTYAGRLDDERAGGTSLWPEDRFCALRERVATAAPAPVEPAFAEGRRWPTLPAQPPATVFRLSVSYWRIGEATAEAPADQAPADQARRLRRRAEAGALSAAELQALAGQPLRAVRPQQPLDVGLFERPAPEAPHILIPDD